MEALQHILDLVDDKLLESLYQSDFFHVFLNKTGLILFKVLDVKTKNLLVNPLLELKRLHPLGLPLGQIIDLSLIHI